MITCAICGKENQSYYKYCLSCGSDLSAAQTPKAAPSVQKTTGRRPCNACSTEVPEGFLFCGKCGARYDEAPPPAAPPPAVATNDRAISASLVVVLPDGSEGGRYSLRSGENIIGRRTGDLFAADVYLSPEHAVLAIARGAVTLKDRGSLNGCYIKLTEEIELKHTDVFRIGQELVRFEYAHESPMLMTPKDDTKIMGSPDPGYWGRILLIIGRDRVGNAFPLAEESVVLGRERADILFPDDGFVSGTHARLSTREGRAFLTDLGSSNGTFIKLREEVTLQSQDHILLGQQLFRIEF